MLRLSSFTEALPNPKKAFMGRSLLSRQDALHICFAGEMDRWTVILCDFLILIFFVLFYANFMPIFRSDFIIFIWHRHHMAGAHFPIAEMAAVLDQIGGLESAKVIMARRYAWGAPGRFFLGKRAG